MTRGVERIVRRYDESGRRSYTVAQGTSDSVVFANDYDIHIFGTVGLNSCSGVLIVGNKGAIAAHINPIPANGNREDFTWEVADATDLFNSKRDALELGSPTMYGTANSSVDFSLC